MTTYDLVVAPIAQLVPCQPNAGLYHRGWASPSPVIPGGALVVEEGRIAFAGKAQELSSFLDGARVRRHIDASDKAVIPGLVDCHTHLPFIGWRNGEIARTRLATYDAVHAGGGGIPSSVHELKSASDGDVLRFCRALLETGLTQGTTTLEGKSGYGLTLAGEMRQLRLLRELNGMTPQTLVGTLLALHAEPLSQSKDEWIRQVEEEIIPLVVSERLAQAVDIYVEPFAYSVKDFERLARRATDFGLATRAHTDQVSPLGAVPVAVQWGARSVDHLNCLPGHEIDVLASSETAAVMLPGADFLRPTPMPPVHSLLDADAIVALASNCNPGTSPIASVWMAVSLGVHLYRMDPFTALLGGTINAAYVLGLSEQIGSLENGKSADFLIVDTPFEMLPFRLGSPVIERVFIKGEEVRQQLSEIPRCDLER